MGKAPLKYAHSSTDREKLMFHLNCLNLSELFTFKRQTTLINRQTTLMICQTIEEPTPDSNHVLNLLMILQIVGV